MHRKRQQSLVGDKEANKVLWNMPRKETKSCGGAKEATQVVRGAEANKIVRGGVEMPKKPTKLCGNVEDAKKANKVAQVCGRCRGNQQRFVGDKETNKIVWKMQRKQTKS